MAALGRLRAQESGRASLKGGDIVVAQGLRHVLTSLSGCDRALIQTCISGLIGDCSADYKFAAVYEQNEL